MSASKKKTAKRLRRTVSERDGAPALSVTAKSALLALPITVAVGLLFLFITTALLMTAKDPDSYHMAAGYIILYLTALIGGAVAVRLNRRRAPLLCGILEGVLLLILITVLGFCLPNAPEHDHSFGVALLTRVLLPIVALIGALPAARTPKKRRHHR